MAGIYVHIPFCKSKCRYCDFTSFPDKLGFAESYMACVYHEMAMRGEQLKNYKFDTLYIGGGTPSVIEPRFIAMLVAAAKKYLNLAENAEITIEMNPGTVSAEKIALYKKCGVNRFSVGLQTAIDSQLEELGRRHTLNQFVTCAKLLKGENFSVDIMLGLKGQTLEDIDKSIRVAASFGASHISSYALTPEDGTPIYTDYLNGELPDGDEVAEMYEFAVEKLRELGFERYEVSNFCKKGRESRHNLNYWRRGEYIGFGVSASSCIGNVRFTNTFDMDEYYKCIMTNRFPVIDSEEIDLRGQMDETVMLAMRTAAGVDVAAFEKQFGCNFKEVYAAALAKNGAYLEEKDGFLRIKDEYLFVQNSVICDFLAC
ncbi:MAG: radical SAM family heme chaperone HemW [Clostridia bacterium]|nr:radical SAM family heme chaperone HemW [Clostridia bacterium]